MRNLHYFKTFTRREKKIVASKQETPIKQMESVVGVSDNILALLIVAGIRAPAPLGSMPRSIWAHYY